MLSMLGKTSAEQHFEIFFLYFTRKIGFDIACKFCMKCRNLFSGKNKKNIMNLSFAEVNCPESDNA